MKKAQTKENKDLEKIYDDVQHEKKDLENRMVLLNNRLDTWDENERIYSIKIEWKRKLMKFMGELYSFENNWKNKFKRS